MKKLLVGFMFLCTIATAQQAEPGAPPPSGQERRQGGRNGGMRFNGTFGTITGIKDDVITIKARSGDEVKVKVSDKTQYRKDQGADAKLADFKVGDTIMVRGEQGADGVWNAQTVGSRPAGGGGGAGGGGNMQQMMAGGMGKVFIAGKVKEMNGTKLTIERPDSQTQVIEVDENTSFKKQNESITLADIKPGDGIFGRGSVKDGVFVPSTLNVGDLQQMRMQNAPR